jgi:hypothetical protein
MDQQGISYDSDSVRRALERPECVALSILIGLNDKFNMSDKRLENQWTDDVFSDANLRVLVNAVWVSSDRLLLPLNQRPQPQTRWQLYSRYTSSRIWNDKFSARGIRILSLSFDASFCAN